MDKFWPSETESLPHPDATPDEESSLYSIEFREGKFGSVKALVFNEEHYIIDVIHEDSFKSAYDAVSRHYPQATWDSEGQ